MKRKQHDQIGGGEYRELFPHPPPQRLWMPGQAVWAEDNTREALFDAMQRKEAMPLPVQE